MKNAKKYLICFFVCNYSFSIHFDLSSCDNHPAEIINEYTFSDSGFDNLFYAYLNEWLIEIGSEYTYEYGLVIRFFAYDAVYPIGFVTDYCVFYIRHDYQEFTNIEFYEMFGLKYPDYYNDEFTYSFLKRYMIEQNTILKGIKEFFDYGGDLSPMFI